MTPGEGNLFQTSEWTLARSIGTRRQARLTKTPPWRTVKRRRSVLRPNLQRGDYQSSRLRATSPSTLSRNLFTSHDETVPTEDLPTRRPVPLFELEAVVSCNSDGLIVVLRRARLPNPSIQPPQLPAVNDGLFAALWTHRPIRPDGGRGEFHDEIDLSETTLMPGHENVGGTQRPPLKNLMRSIRDVAVFSWALISINKKLVSFGQGFSQGEAVPPDGPLSRGSYCGYAFSIGIESGRTKVEKCWKGCVHGCDLESPSNEYCSSHT